MSKKKAGGKTAKAGEEEDESTTKFPKLYRKKCEANNVPICKLLMSRIDDANGESEHVNKIHLWEEIYPAGTRAIFETFEDLEYKHIKSIRLWKTQVENEGTRSICNFIQKTKTIECLDLLENGLTELGCEFIGKQVIHPMNQVPIIKLKLDHNHIGLNGLKNLTEGLAVNSTLTSLSLNYCGLQADSVQYIQQIISYINTNLEKLKLQGNLLQNTGVYQLFRGLEGNSKLEKINIADNQFSQESEGMDLIGLICEVMKKNTTLGAYDLRFNGIYDESASKFLIAVAAGKHIHQLKMNEHISTDIAEDLKALMKKNKPKKKKKGKKGGKKKKKKK